MIAAVAGRSDRIVPALVELSPGHLVACHRFPGPGANDPRSDPIEVEAAVP